MNSFNLIKQLPFIDSSHLKSIVLHDPNILQRLNDGKSVLHHAILTGNVAGVEAILQYKGFTDIADPNGETPLLAACRMNQLWTVDQLVKAGANTSARDARGAGCCHAAAAAGRLTVLQYLREVAALPLAERDQLGRTPLMLAAAAGHPHTLAYLITNARSAVALRDAEGDTALHHAARAGHAHICWLLMTRAGPPQHVLSALLSATNHAGLMPHQTGTPQVSGYLLRARRAGGVPPSARLLWVGQLLRPALTVALALSLCALTPASWAHVLNPAIVLLAAYSLRGQNHRLNHPSRQASPLAVGGVAALIGACVGAALFDMRSHLLAPPVVTLLSMIVTAGLVLVYAAALRSDPGPAAPAADVAAALRRAAATPTGQTAWCPICQCLWRSGRERHHCRLCDRCYPSDLDHHCLYLYTCVAAGNRRAYLRLLLLAALAGGAYLGHAAAFVGWLPRGRRVATLLGGRAWTASCAGAVAATLLLLRPLVAAELRQLWARMDGGRCRRLHRLARYVAGRADIATEATLEKTGIV